MWGAQAHTYKYGCIGREKCGILRLLCGRSVGSGSSSTATHNKQLQVGGCKSEPTAQAFNTAHDNDNDGSSGRRKHLLAPVLEGRAIENRETLLGCHTRAVYATSLQNLDAPMHRSCRKAKADMLARLSPSH